MANKIDEQLLSRFEEVSSPLDIKSKFVTPRLPETNHLEFKEKRDSRVPNLESDDKRNFSKTLSAFSNADGGILIWGVRTKHLPDNGGDVAWSLKPITRANEMAERLRSSLLDILMPQNPGIRIEAVTNRLGNGYVKCLIPASDNPPHRAMIGREYWARLDGRNIRLEHYMIRDMMLRHEYPQLRFSTYTRRIGELQQGIRVQMRLQNCGRAVAKYAGWFGSLNNAEILSVSGCRNITDVNNGRPTVSWDAPVGTVIHPNGIAIPIGTLVLGFLNKDQPIGVLAKIYCEGMTTRDIAWTLKYPEDGSPGVWQMDLENTDLHLGLQIVSWQVRTHTAEVKRRKGHRNSAYKPTHSS